MSPVPDPKSRASLESAPVPISRYAGSNFWSFGKSFAGPSCDGSSRCVTSRIRGSSARGLAVVLAMPDLVLLKTVVACSRSDGARVELGVLVQGDNVTGM